LPARGGQEYLVFGDLRLGGVEFFLKKGKCGRVYGFAPPSKKRLLAFFWCGCLGDLKLPSHIYTNDAYDRNYRARHYCHRWKNAKDSP